MSSMMKRSLTFFGRFSMNNNICSISMCSSSYAMYLAIDFALSLSGYPPPLGHPKLKPALVKDPWETNYGLTRIRNPCVFPRVNLWVLTGNHNCVMP